jgi:GT2 family glycosyltransferase
MSTPARPQLSPRLSVVVVTYNSRADIDACLASLTQPPLSIAHEIAVVDNGSADGTAQHLRERWPAVRTIDAGGNVGFARANNIGIRATSGELVLLLNPDTVVPPRAIERLAAALDARPDAAVAGPRLIDRDGAAELSFGRMITPWAELRQKMLVAGSERRLPIVHPMVQRMTRRSRSVDWVSGACLLIRRADLEAVGLMDERFFLYTEDVDLCASVRARGRDVVFVSNVEVLHLRGRSGAGAPRPTHDAYRRSQVAFYEKHHPGGVRWLKTYLRLRGRLR